MSYSGTRVYRGARPPQGYRARGRGRAAASWLLKAVLTALLGLAGYLFVTDMAVPSLVDGITGQHQSQD